MRTAGIPSLGIAVVFHQFGAPSSEIFSSVVSLLTRSGTDAFRKLSFDIASRHSCLGSKLRREGMKAFRRSLPLPPCTYTQEIVLPHEPRGSDAARSGKTSGANLNLECQMGIAHCRKGQLASKTCARPGEGESDLARNGVQSELPNGLAAGDDPRWCAMTAIFRSQAALVCSKGYVRNRRAVLHSHVTDTAIIRVLVMHG